jgi:UDP-N-acetylmuramoyl-tripeptide--D-alanyl-D-alanine ligase
MHVDSDFILKNLAQASVVGKFPSDSNFSVDTRTLQQGDVFVALSGARVDGHDFIGQALQKGALGILANVLHQEKILEKYVKELENKSIIFVTDTYQALIDLAYAWRSQFVCPVVAITGTVGKTTTKEMVRNILKQTGWQFVASSGNQNTLVGVSLNILKMRAEHKAAVFEVGIAEVGSMKKLVELLRPTVAVVTFVGHGHMQGLGDLAQVAREKREVFSLLSEQNVGIINGDQPELSSIKYQHPIMSFGLKSGNQIQAKKVLVANNSISFTLKIYQKKYTVLLPTCNQARVSNALGAIAVGKALGIADELLIAGVCQPILVDGRFAILPHVSGSIIIHDAYNSNPESVKASLQAFENYQTTLKKVLVLGDMMELGDKTDFWHKKLGKMVGKMAQVDSVVLIGVHTCQTQKTLPLGLKTFKFDNIEDALPTIESMLLQKDKVFLCKASNSLRFSQLVQHLLNVRL